mgnify:CR=1 FL=1
MNIQNIIETKVKEGFLALYNIEIPSVEFQATRKEFEGDITVVVFPLLRYKKGNPVQIGEDLGKYVVENVDEIKNTWASLTGLEDNAFRDTLEVCENRDAYEHLLKLTSGLESLVVGEEQILGQIKESISAARKVDASGKRLNKLFERSNFNGI